MVFMNWFKKKPVRVYEAPARKRPPTAQESAMTVKADPNRLTPAIEADIREQITSLPDIPENERAFVIEQAVESIRAGGNLRRLTVALEKSGVETPRAAEIASGIDSRSRSMINIDRQASLGLFKAKWTYSGAPCFFHRGYQKDGKRRDDIHRKANGKEYDIRRGLKLDGEYTHPGFEWGCKCSSKILIPDLDD